MDETLTPPTEETAPGHKRLTLSSVIIFAFIFALLGLLGWGLWNNTGGPRESDKAPDFSLTTFEGETINLSDFQGQVVVINFWAS